MFRPVAVFIGLRYLRAKRRQRFISFISFASILGIALGIAVLITVLSVMNGFDKEIHQQLFKLSRQVTVSTRQGEVLSWQSLDKIVSRQAKVQATSPYLDAQGMLVHEKHLYPVRVTGVLPSRHQKVSNRPRQMRAGRFSALRPGRYGVVLNEGLAYRLGVKLGDKITLMTPKFEESELGIAPRFRRVRLVGIYQQAMGGKELAWVFMHLSDVQHLWQRGEAISALQLAVPGVTDSFLVQRQLQQQLKSKYVVSHWASRYVEYFKAIRLEKTMMFFILFLIVAVAMFNLMASLVMLVNDKRADIAILQTMGALPRHILAIFMVQGTAIGLLGIGLGVLGGVVLSWHVSEVVFWLEKLLHRQFISAAFYYIDFLPANLRLEDVLSVGGGAFLMSVLGTLYPAWKASRLNPVEALRYE